LPTKSALRPARLLFVALIGAALAAPPALAQSSQPFQASVRLPEAGTPAGSTLTLEVTFHIPEGHYLYRDKTGVQVTAPAGVQAGEAVLPAPIVHQDKFSGGEKEIYTATFTTTVPLRIDPAARPGRVPLVVAISWQGCNDQLCYFPTTREETVELEVTAAPGNGRGGAGADARPAQTPARGGLADFGRARERGSFWMYLAAFLGGILTSLTPCVLPIVPLTITVIGARGASRARSFALSLVYVLGIAFTYSTLGVLAATTGALFGSLFQSTWFLIGAIALFVVLAFGLFGAYELQLPAGLRNRLMAKQGSGWGGIFLMGLVAGLVASPCVGPVLVGVLAFIAQTGNVLFGFTLLFTFALGMGVLFLVVGTFSAEIKRMPSGPWMTAIENGLGVLMLGVAFYYLWVLLEPFPFALLLGATVVVGGVFLGAFLRLDGEGAGSWAKVRKALGILLVASGLYLFVGALMTRGVFLPPLAGTPGRGAAATGEVSPGGEEGIDSAAAGVVWSDDLEAALLLASMERKPVIIDFTADWCVVCRELDHYTFSDPAVVAAFRDFILVRIDLTDSASEANQRYQREYVIFGLPNVTFLTPEGVRLADLTVTGFVKAQEFLAVLARAREASHPPAGM
jgi:thiol:disulfide interchange protein DsbD